MDHIIIVRYSSELTLKGKQAQSRFIGKLRAHILSSFERRGLSVHVQAKYNHLLVETSDMAQGISILGHIFGIDNFSPVLVIVDSNFDEIVEKGIECFGEAVKGKTFAVAVKRTGNQKFRSIDIAKELGGELTDRGGKVKLKGPEVSCHVDIINEKAYLFKDRIKGAGGFPTGVQGKAVCLMSGGFDSTVAAWRMLKRGVEVDYVFCNLGGAAYERLVLQVVKVLSETWGHYYQPKLHVIEFAPLLQELKENVRDSCRQVVLKRLMYRAAEKVAFELRSEAIVTGESIGQVSSQTMGNLAVIEMAVDVPVFRPLLGYDKQEIMDEAQRIGTAVLSERIKEYCSISKGAMVVTKRPKLIQWQESLVDLSLIDRACTDRKIIDVNSVGAKDLRATYLFTDNIPKDAVIIDCQPTHQFKGWHVDSAKNFQLEELMTGYRKLDKDKTYVLYCTFGTQTPYVAEVMQQAGYEAYAFKGGISKVREYFRSHDQ